VKLGRWRAGVAAGLGWLIGLTVVSAIVADKDVQVGAFTLVVAFFAVLSALPVAILRRASASAPASYSLGPCRSMLASKWSGLNARITPRVGAPSEDGFTSPTAASYSVPMPLSACYSARSGVPRAPR
jgi:hypothetical protein